MDLPPLVTPLSIVVGLLATGYLVYQAFFHPLSKYPGPVLGKFTNARSAYYAWKGDTHLDIWRCHQKYGAVIRYAPNEIIMDTAGALQDLYTHERNVQKPRILQHMSHKARDILTTVDAHEHAIRRRLIGRSLSGFRDIEPRLLSHVRWFSAHIETKRAVSGTPDAEWGPTMNMADWCSYLAFDMMVDLVYGLNYNLVGDETHRDIVTHIGNSRVRTAVLLRMPLLYLGRLDKKVFRGAVFSRYKFLSFVDRLMADVSALTKAEGRKRGIFGSLSAFRDEQSGRKLSDVEVRAEAVFLTIAGYDTTATALGALLFYLTRCPHAYTKLADEVRRIFTHPDQIHSGKPLSSCRYLRACIDEALRLSPPVACQLQREVKPGGAWIDGCYLPAGTYVGTGVYSIHHNETYFPRPHEFIPERWLTGPSDQWMGFRHEGGVSAFVPFSKGRRSCAGVGIAYWELSVVVASLLVRYDFRATLGPEGALGAGDAFAGPGRGNPYEYQMYDRITCGGRGPNLQFRPRQACSTV